MKRLSAGIVMAMAAIGWIAHAQPGDPLPPAARDLWLGTEGRYVRQWLLLGPLTAEAADRVVSDASLDPSPPAWRAASSWGDVTNALDAIAVMPGDRALAFATVTRERAGDAVIALGGPVTRAWLNGRPLATPRPPRAFVQDGATVRAPMAAGPNRILLELTRAESTALLSLRVVEPGFPIDTSGAIGPYLEATGPELRVRLANPGATGDAPVRYEAVAAGGRVMADATRPRTDDVRFDTTAWPDGAHEVRVTTADRRGVEILTHVPWYKGDAGEAARRLLADASRQDADGHEKMLADLVRDRLASASGRAPGATPRKDDWPLLHSPLLEREELALERAGQTGGARSSGFVRLSWTDDVDGSTQFCRVFLPSGYPGGREWPAVVWLHGYHPENPPYVRWWSIADRHDGVAERQGAIVIAPFGRGNVDYRWIGERDVLRCLDEANRRLAIDDDRVSIGGESMGGNGTWLIASRHPQRFAAAAPVFGGWDSRVFPGAYMNPRATKPYELYGREVPSSFVSAEGLRNVPVLVTHGDQDAGVTVEHSRHAARMLQRWGYDLRYHEVPGRAHEELNLREPIVAWLVAHRRGPEPREVRLRSFDLEGARAHWVAVTGWLDPVALVEASASVVGPGLVRLETRNVASVRLSPPRALAGDGPVRVSWNGDERTVGRDADGTLTLAQPGVEARPGDKSPAREGRLTYFFGTPFAIVAGTSSPDPAMASVIREKADALARLWEGWQHAQPRLLRDDEVTADVERRHSLLLVGGPAENRVAARYAARLPLGVTTDTITVDGRAFAARDAVAQMLYPSPTQPEHYVLVVAPTSTAGMRTWDPGGFWVQNNGYPKLHWDFTITDGRRAKLEDGMGVERAWIAAGIFDRHWRRDDRWVFGADDPPGR